MPEPGNHPFAEIRTGDKATLTRTLTQHDLDGLATLSGEVDPAGPDASAPANAQYRQSVTHGMWGSALISTVLGRQLPGAGTILLHQSLDFLAPVAVGDKVDVTVNVEALDPVHQSVRLSCSVVNQRSETVIAGTATVIAPHEKIGNRRVRLSAHEDRGVGDNFRKLIALTAGMAPLRVAVIHPLDPPTLKAACEAAMLGLITPVLVGPAHRIHAAAADTRFDLDGIEVVDTAHSAAAIAAAMAMAASGQVEAVMSSALRSADLNHAIRAASAPPASARRLSHVYIIDAPGYARPLFITDAIMNLAPDLEAKRDIAQNAVDLVRALGSENPRVAILCATETVIAAMQSTVDAAALCKMAERHQITGALVDGPLAFDDAVSAQAALVKGIVSPVAGHADILLMPDAQAGAMLARQLAFLGQAQMAGIVLGARVPILLVSRADSTLAQLGACASALLLARREQGCQRHAPAQSTST